MRHELNAGLEPFMAIIEGRKSCTLVPDGPGPTYREADALYLRETDDDGKHTGRAVEVEVTYVEHLLAGMVAMSHRPVSELIVDSWPAQQDNPAVTKDILSLASADVSLEAIIAWSPAERRLADEWAAAVILNASDHTDIVIPAIPHCVERDRVR